MFSSNQGFPLTGFIKTMMVLSALGTVAMIGSIIALVVWLFTHVRIG